MKSMFFSLIVVLSINTVSAQLVVTPSGELFMNGDVPVTLRNFDLINNGIFAGGVNTISFTGDASSTISGSGTLRFFQLNINKSGDREVTLQKSIDVVNSVQFTSGFLNLNGFNVDLESSGKIEGENNDSRFIGPNGGLILLRSTLNAPANINPGNLGMVFTSNQDLGEVVIKRGHQLQTGNGLTTSVHRFYEVSPVNNNGVTASLRFNYFDAELNGMDENSMSFFKSNDFVNWTNIGSTSRDAAVNFVEKAGIDPFSRFTLSSAGNSPLPVRFIVFNVDCDGNKVSVKWKTAQEVNSSYFNIERSVDGVNWSVIGKVSAAGNTSGETSYMFTDNSPLPNSFYRIAEYDLNGKAQYTSQLRSSCNTTDLFSVWPNPVHEKIFINIIASNESQAVLKLFDNKGSLLKMQKAALLKGSNQLNLDMTSLANGVYYLSAGWNNGQTNKTVQVVKR